MKKLIYFYLLVATFALPVYTSAADKDGQDNGAASGQIALPDSIFEESTEAKALRAAKAEMDAARQAYDKAEVTAENARTIADTASDTTEKQAKEAAKTAEKAAKQARKAYEKAVDKLNDAKETFQNSLKFAICEQAVNNRRFVIIADQLRLDNGYTLDVNHTTNFVMLQDDKATVQFAFDGVPWSGANGMGGLTVEGSVSNFKINHDSKGNLFVSMMVTGTAITADITFSLPKNGTLCTATVTSSFHGTKLSFIGELKPYNYSHIFQGRTLL